MPSANRQHTGLPRDDWRAQAEPRSSSGIPPPVRARITAFFHADPVVQRMNPSLATPVWFFLRALLLSALCWPGSALAQPNELLQEIAVLRDDSGALTFEAVRQADFVAHQGVFSAGYTEAVHWLRVVVQPRPQGGSVKLLIRPAFVDHLTLYEPDPTRPGHWRQREGGDHQLAGDNDRGLNSLGFLVYPQAPHTTYYLRLQSTSTSLLDVQALPPSEANRQEARLALWNFAYLALLLGMVGWGIKDYLHARQKVMGCFVLYQSSNVLYTFALMGYFSVFEGPHNSGFADVATSISMFLITPTALLFHKVFLQPYRPHWLLLQSFNALCLLSLLQPVLYLAGWEQRALSNNALLGLIASVVIIASAFSIREQGQPSRRHIHATYALLGLAQVLYLMAFLGLLDAHNWSLQWPLVPGLLMAILIFMTLYQRSRQLRQELKANAQMTVLANAQLQQEKAHAESLTQFIDMLSHEIKTPLAVAMMNLGALRDEGPYWQRAQRALSNIDAIMERTRLSEAAEQRRLQVQIQKFNISELVYECIETSTAPERIEANVCFALEAHSDAGLLTIIISNLIDNALKYAPANAPVHLSLNACEGEDGREIQLSLCNAVGPAGPPDPEQVFNKFYRSPSAYAQSGSGLGLYLSRNVAEMLGAHLHYHPQSQLVKFTLCIAA
jgi:signal transduction histidine kinase